MNTLAALLLALSMSSNPYACMTPEAEQIAKAEHWQQVEVMGDAVFDVQVGE